MRALIVTGDGFEDSEFTYPKYRLLEADAEVDVATADGGSFESKHGQSFEADLTIGDADPDDYDLLVVPGGRAPENMRLEAPETADVIRAFDEAGKPIASICHGVQLLISADVLGGRRATGYQSLEVDVENAGATFVDEVTVDGNLVTARTPDDLPAFMAETFALLEESETVELPA